MAHSVIALAATHDVQRFDCGTPELNAWLQQIAGQHGRKNLSKTFVLVEDDEPDKVLGYYALAVRAMTPKEKLAPALAKRLPRDVPGFTLARLAISKEVQGQGWGADLLMSAMARVREAGANVGGYAFFIDAKNLEAASFYAHFGFVPLPSDPLTLYMPLSEFPI